MFFCFQIGTASKINSTDINYNDRLLDYLVCKKLRCLSVTRDCGNWDKKGKKNFRPLVCTSYAEMEGC